MPKKKNHTKKRNALVQQKNRARGLASAANATSYPPQENGQLFRKRLQGNLLSAREQLQPKEYDSYLKWLMNQTGKIVSSQSIQTIEYRELNWVPPSKPMAFEQELEWIVARLSCHQPELSDFCKHVSELEKAVWLHDGSAAEEMLNQIQTKFGSSIWLVEIRIALTQHFHGLEAQKTIKNIIKQESRGGLVAFIAHYVGVRNEPSVTPVRFIEQIQNRIEKSPLDKSIKAYLRFRLTKELPTEKSGLAEILRIEQSHSIVDIYETFISILQHILCSDLNEAVRNSMSAAIKRISNIDDFRLDKASLVFGYIRREPNIDIRANHSRSLLLSGEVSQSYFAATRLMHAGFLSIENLITAGHARAHAVCRPLTVKPMLLDFVLERVAILFAKNSQLDVAITDLVKLSLNLGNLPNVKAVNGICMQEGMPLQIHSKEALLWMRLNSPSYQPEDLIVAQAAALKILEEQLAATIGKTAGYDYTQIVRKGHVGSTSLHKHCSAYAAATHYLNNMDPTSALDLIRYTINEPLPTPSKFASMRLVAECFLQSQLLDEAYNLITNLTMQNEVVRHVLPIQQAVSGRKWPRVAPFADKLRLSIVLDLHLRESSDQHTATLRRAAVAEFLRRHGMRKPSDLFPSIAEFDLGEVVYFYSRVCISSVLDMLPALTSSQDVERERKQILGILTQIDKANTEAYQVEIFSISRRLSIEAGLRLVDESRLHVDEDSILSWADRELRETYRRYIDLVKAGVGVADDFTSVFSKAMKIQDAPSKLLKVPESEADELIISMLGDLKEQFLMDASHGLDSYLSRRIRHNTMHGLLRGPVEFSKLITQRDKLGGNYTENLHWLGKLQPETPEQAKIISKHFISFAQEFDEVVLKLKDDRLHIKTSEKPNGMFDLILTPVVFHIARSAVQETEATLEQFVSMCIRLFWGLLQPSLENVRHLLQHDVKHEMSRVFDKLKNNISKNSSQNTWFASLSQAIGDSQNRVAGEIDKVAEWFHQHETTGSHPFSLNEMIDIGLTAALTAHTAYEPSITLVVNTPTDCILDFSALHIIHDIVWIAIDNVYAHSKIEKSPKIKISVSLDEEKKLLSFSIVNQIASGVRTPNEEKWLKQCKQEIDDGGYKERLNKEGRSGLKKLAGMVHKSEIGKLEFGYISDVEFKLDIAIEIIIPESSAPLNDKNREEDIIYAPATH